MISFNQEKSLSHVGSVLLWTWVAFTSFYTLFSFAYPFIQKERISAAEQSGYVQGANAVTAQAMQSFSGNVFQNGYSSAVTQLVQELEKQYNEGCQNAVPVNVGTGSIGLLSANCLQKLTAQAGSGTTAPATPQKK